jgi:hypothetical protein
MISKCFTLGVYEDRPPYFGFLAEAARSFVREGLLEEINILWYRLNQKLLDWTEDVRRGHTNHASYPFGEKPYLINLTRKDDRLPVEATGLQWSALYGQKDIPPDLITRKHTPGKFYEIIHQAFCPPPNVLVVDHELFRRETAEAHSEDGSAHLIIEGLRQYYGGESHTPPIFLSSYRALAAVASLDTLGIGRGRGTRLSWFPRSDEKQPTKLPDGFTQALREEVTLWVRNRELFGAKYGRANWISYNPPFDRTVVYYERNNFPKLDWLKSEAGVVVRDEGLLPNEEVDGLLARHCRAYLEVRQEVSQSDVERLQGLAEEYPLPIVLIYMNTNQNVSSLGDCGVLVYHVKPHDGHADKQVEAAAGEWVRRMAGLDTVVGGQRLREIRDDLLRWRLGTVPDEVRVPKMDGGRVRPGDNSDWRNGTYSRALNPGGRAVLVTGPTGAGKTAVSRWCHFYSGHITQDDKAVREMWENIRVPNPGKKGFALSLKEIVAKAGNKGNPRGKSGDAPEGRLDFIEFWAKTLIDHGGGKQNGRGKKAAPANGDAPADSTSTAYKAYLEELLLDAFKSSGNRPWQVNLVGSTRADEFTMQIAGAYPSWSGNLGASDWRPGAILNATNNSLILNEVGELNGRAQGLLLELIERGGPIRPMFAPMAGEIKAQNVLFIMATDRVDKVRSQLRYRCRVLPVPSLLECQEDIPELARHRLLPRWCCLSERAEQILKVWPYWPGNHRSLHAVLDFAAERLPSSRRVIRVREVINALWREGLFRVPARLENLLNWVLGWPEIDADDLEDSILPRVKERLAILASEDWPAFIDHLNRIAELTLENPSAHFTDLLGTKKPEPPADKKQFISAALGVLFHEIFLTLEKSTSRLDTAIKSGKKVRDQRLDEIVGTDFDRRLAVELRDEAIVTLSLGTLLWRGVGIKPAEIAEANTLLAERPLKPSGRKPKGFGAGDSGDRAADAEKGETPDVEDGGQKVTGRRKSSDERGGVPIYNTTKISETVTSAGRLSLAIMKVLDSPFSGSLFNYVDDRRDRNYF